MQVRETTLQELISGVRQFRVPLFQRRFTWTTSNHRQLWEDILDQYEGARRSELPGGTGHGHFLGSFVLAPMEASATLPAFLVVDGQQRFTTLTLALCALRDAMSPTDPEAQARFNETYLLNRWQKGEDRWKLIPTQDDRESYFACIDNKAGKGGTDKIGEAYRFYATRLAELGPDEQPLDLVLLEQVIVSRLSIVDITAQRGDNVHRIFESLNATGVNLTQADLLRNYIFMLLPKTGESVYRDEWLPMENHLGTAHLEGLFRVDMQRRGVEIRDDDVYREQQARLEPIAGDEGAIADAVRDLRLRARHYRRILDPSQEPDIELRRRLAFLRRWKATTAYPLVMYLYELLEEKRCALEEARSVLQNVESFLVRRLIVGVSAGNLNRIFIRLVRVLRQSPDDPLVDEVRVELSSERKYWASDDALRAAIGSRPFYYYGRAEQRRMVLERLEESFDHREQAQLARLDLSVEHIMPQSLSQAWRDALVAQGDDPDAVQRDLLHVLGNLTLTAYNGTLSNHPFERKLQIYGDSHLSLNRALLEETTWGREEICRRADALADRAIALWPAPVPGVSDDSDGFDWTRAHAAIAAIPAGRWTTHADIAQVAGTTPAAVEYHLGAHPGLPSLHRVLKSPTVADGPAAAGGDGGDAGVRSVLIGEGVRFVDDGADVSQHIGGEELLGLLTVAEESELDDPQMEEPEVEVVAGS